MSRRESAGPHGPQTTNTGIEGFDARVEKSMAEKAATLHAESHLKYHYWGTALY
jgi:hypothetical protein